MLHDKVFYGTVSHILTLHAITCTYIVFTRTHTHTHLHTHTYTHTHTHTHRDVIDLHGIQMDLAGMITEQGEDVDWVGQCLFTCALIIMFEIEGFANNSRCLN